MPQSPQTEAKMTFITLEGVRRRVDTVPVDPRSSELHYRNKAIRGSRRLRDAIWKLQGYKPTLSPKPKTKVTLCPTCLSPIVPRQLIAEIQQTVAAFFGYHRSTIISDDRRREVVNARWIAMYLSCELTHHSIAEVGRRFNRDHTSVLHALKCIKSRCEHDEELALNVTLLRERLGA